MLLCRYLQAGGLVASLNYFQIANSIWYSVFGITRVSGEVGISNTIKRAELAGVASVPRAKFTQIATPVPFLYLRSGNAVFS